MLISNNNNNNINPKRLEKILNLYDMLYQV